MTFSLDDVERFIAANTWKFAKTMPQMPHWYVVRSQASSEADYLAAVKYIIAHGKPRKFGRTTFVYLDVGDFMYWTLEDAEATKILNRAVRSEKK